MAEIRQCYVVCDASWRVSLCDEESAAYLTIVQARESARLDGWVRVKGLDVCPLCVQSAELAGLSVRVFVNDQISGPVQR
jgi:hypothetical protein